MYNANQAYNEEENVWNSSLLLLDNNDVLRGKALHIFHLPVRPHRVYTEKMNNIESARL